MNLNSYIFRKFVFTKKSLKSKGVWLSLAGLFLATLLVFVTLGVLSGYQNVYKKAVLNFSAHVIVHHPFGLNKNKVESIQKFLESKNPGSVSSAYYFYETLAPTNNGFQPIIFKAIDLSKKHQVYPVQYSMQNKSGLILGAKWFKQQPKALKTQTFSFVKSDSKNSESKGFLQSLPVAGTFQTGYYDFDSKFALMDLDLFEAQFSKKALYDGLEIRLPQASKAHALKEQLVKQFPHEFDVLTWDEMNLELFDALKLEQTVVFLISFVVLLVGCFNIFGMNFLFIKSRQADFQILLALGYGKKAVLALIQRASFYVGLVAVGLSCGLSLLILTWLNTGGVPLNPQVYLVDHVPADYPVAWFCLYAVASVILSQLSALFAGIVVVQRHMSKDLLS